MRALDQQGYTTPTPIQAQAIPLVKAGHDILGVAQTGTGKTAAFALPTIDYLIREERDAPKRGGRVLVLAPTRELAQQIAQSFRTYGKHMGLTVACIFGGASVRGQIKAVVGGNDVLVATPGRLLDLIDQKALRLSEIEVLILDEADQMMDMGFIHALRKIVPMLPKKRQTLFFSATMPKKILQLADQFLTNPKTVSVTPAASTAERVEQQIYKCAKNEKQALLITLLGVFEYNRVLVFSRTKHGADRLVKKLVAAGFPADALHGNKSQGQRQRILAAFKGGKSDILVATDIAARGIDIDGITHVINYDLPNQADQYVHRIGRTARAGRSGLAVSFCSPDENSYLKDIQKLIKQTLPVMPLPEDFNKKVAAVARMKPAPDEGKSHSSRNDPRRHRGGGGGRGGYGGGKSSEGHEKNAVQALRKKQIPHALILKARLRLSQRARKTSPLTPATKVATVIGIKALIPPATVMNVVNVVKAVVKVQNVENSPKHRPWAKPSGNPDGSRAVRKKRTAEHGSKQGGSHLGEKPSGEGFKRKPRKDGPPKGKGPYKGPNKGKGPYKGKGKPSGGRPSGPAKEGGGKRGERSDPTQRSGSGQGGSAKRGGSFPPKRRR